jgi:hypothetical protein
VVVVFRRGGKAHLSNPAAKIDHVVRWPEGVEFCAAGPLLPSSLQRCVRLPGDGTLQFDATLYAKAQGFERKVFKCAVEEWDPVTKRRGPKQLAEFDVDIGALASKSLSTTTTFSSDKGGCITLQCRLDPLITSEAESEAHPPKRACASLQLFPTSPTRAHACDVQPHQGSPRRFVVPRFLRAV